MIDAAPIQRRLERGGYDIGEVDGVLGPKTWAGIFAFIAQRPVGSVQRIGAAAATHLPRFGINTKQRIANFIGQAAHESGRFRYLREIWGPTPTQLRYEGRKDLGNTVAGDGHRFLGRGIFQLTGRANYREAGRALGLDLESTPTLAETPDVAVQTACWFWQSKGLSTLADAGREDDITRRINGGTNGIDDRRVLVARARGLFL